MASPLKEITCPSCGASVPQYDPASQTLVCRQCGAHIATGGEAAQLMGKKSNRIPRPPVPINLGETFTYEDVQYTVLGRVIYQGWDDEERWTWHEWLLGSSMGRMLWLSHDEKGLSLYEKIRFRGAFDPQRDRVLDTPDGQKIRIHERYPARIIGAEGELTWQAQIDERSYVAEGAGHGKRYSVQQTANEMEIYVGHAIDELAVAQSFNDDDWVKRVKQRERNRLTMAVIGILCLIFAGIALIMAVTASFSGDVTARETITLGRDLPPVSIPVTLTESRAAIVGIRLQGGIPQNTFVDIEVSITSPDETVEDLFFQDIWYETGYDDEGPWSERQYENSDMFVPTQSGPHVLLMEFDPESSASINQITLNVEVRDNHVLPMWFMVYAVIAGVTGGMAFISGIREL